jgi:phenylacetate-CoA ligase
MDEAGINPGEIDGPDALRRLPILRKRDVQASKDLLLSARAQARDLERKATSGTTATPLRFFRDRRVEPLGQATWWQALDWAGASPADPHVFSPLPAGPNDEQVRFTRWHRLTGSRLLPFASVTDRNAAQVIAFLEHTAPGIISAYPSYLHLLSRLILDSGAALRFRPRVIFYSGEQMGEDTRDLVTSAFGSPIFSRYGANEFSAMVAQTCEHGGWHINTEGFIVEILDGQPGDRQGAPSRHGRMVITDLRNFVMPFIRYEIGDVAWAGDSTRCPCGRSSPVLGGLEGRAEEYLTTGAGRRIPVTAFHRILRVQSDCFWEYQLHQHTPTELELWVVPRQTYTNDQADALTAHLEKFFDYEVSVRIRTTDRIPREPSGKRPVLKTTVAAP